MKKILFALALLLTIGAIEASAQSNPPLSNKRIRMKGQAAAPTPDPPTGYYNLWVDSGSGNLYITNSAGTDTPVGAGISGLTDNVIPQANGTTAIENSKMTASGTNSGTWTLYDDTAVTGLTKLVITGGAGQGTDPLMALSTPAGISFAYFTLGTPTESWQTATDLSTGNLYFYEVGGAATRFSILNGVAAVAVTGQYLFNPANAANVGLENPASGIIKFTDGSTGQGGIGIADSATNTVSDALILRHATSGTAAASFGTGLLFQGEDAAGNMQDMGSIDAVYVAATNGAEDTDFKFYTMRGGAEELSLTLDSNFFGSAAKALVFPGDAYVWASGTSLFLGGGGVEWELASIALNPVSSNQNTIGSSSKLMKDAYVSTSVQGTRTKTLTDNTITDVVQISSTAGADANGVTAGHVSYTIIASDATTDKVQTEVGQLPFLLVNENGTVTVTLGTVGVTAIDSAGGAALSNTFASSVSGTNAKIRVTSDYDQATLTGAVTHTIEYRVYIDSGTATVTPQ